MGMPNEENHAKLQFCSFWLDEQLFGVDILDVKEINRELSFTPIFHAPPEVKGYVNIRGQIYLVLDLRLLLGFAPIAIGQQSRTLIFKTTVGESFGVLVDRIGDIVEIEADHIELRAGHEESSRGTTDRMREIIRGECKLDEGLMIILDARHFLGVVERATRRE